MRDRRITDGSREGVRPSRGRKERIHAFLQSETADACGFECRTGHDPGVVDAYCLREARDPVEPWGLWQPQIIARCGIIGKTKSRYAAVKARKTERVSVLVVSPQLCEVGNRSGGWIDVVDLIGDVITKYGSRENGGYQYESPANSGVHCRPPFGMVARKFSLEKLPSNLQIIAPKHSSCLSHASGPNLEIRTLNDQGIPYHGQYAIRGRWLSDDYTRLRNAAWAVTNSRVRGSLI